MLFSEFVFLRSIINANVVAKVVSYKNTIGSLEEQEKQCIGARATNKCFDCFFEFSHPFRKT